MAYAQAADIQSALVNVGPFDSTSKPTSNEVAAYIAEVEAEMNAVLASAGITVPVTATEKLILVRKICVDGAAAKVLRATQMEPEQAKAFQDLYEKALERIRANPAEIESTTGSGAGGYVTGPAPRTEKPYTREDRQW